MNTLTLIALWPLAMLRHLWFILTGRPAFSEFVNENLTVGSFLAAYVLMELARSRFRFNEDGSVYPLEIIFVGALIIAFIIWGVLAVITHFANKIEGVTPRRVYPLFPVLLGMFTALGLVEVLMNLTGLTLGQAQSALFVVLTMGLSIRIFRQYELYVDQNKKHNE